PSRADQDGPDQQPTEIVGCWHRCYVADLMSVTYQRLCAWAGPFCAFLWIIALLFLADFIPPPHPTWGADKIAHTYADNPTGIRLGMVVLLIGGVLYQPWVAAI